MNELAAAWAEWREEVKFENFCYWMKGMIDAKASGEPLSIWKVELIEQELTKVFGEKPTANVPPHPEMPPIPRSKWEDEVTK